MNTFGWAYLNLCSQMNAKSMNSMFLFRCGNTNCLCFHNFEFNIDTMMTGDDNGAFEIILDAIRHS